MILMDLQYAAVILANSQHELMQVTIAQAAREERVGCSRAFPSRAARSRLDCRQTLSPLGAVCIIRQRAMSALGEPWSGPSMRRGTDSVAIGQQGGILQEGHTSPPNAAAGRIQA
jgi:hypothetical protein